MFILRHLFVLTGTALLSSLLGFVVGLMTAPATGAETRAWVASLVDKHGPAMMDNVRKGQHQVGRAVDYVAARVDSATDGSN